jgi:hypothetical protein
VPRVGVMARQEVDTRAEEACGMLEHGAAEAAVALHLQVKHGVSRATAYRDLTKARTIMASDDGPSMAEIDDAAAGADLAPLLSVSIQTALARGDVAAVKTLMGCLDKALTWRGLNGAHSRYRQE